jgi:hypothetical protein
VLVLPVMDLLAVFLLVDYLPLLLLELLILNHLLSVVYFFLLGSYLNLMNHLILLLLAVLTPTMLLPLVFDLFLICCNFDLSYLLYILNKLYDLLDRFVGYLDFRKNLQEILQNSR